MEPIRPEHLARPPRSARDAGVTVLLVLGLVATAGLAFIGAADPTALGSRPAILIGAFALCSLFVALLIRPRRIIVTRTVIPRPQSNGNVVRVIAQPSPSPAPSPAPSPSKGERSRDPFGDVYPVIDVEGIGEVYAARLEPLGITTTRELWRADAARIGRELGIHPNLVRNWQAMAELMAVRDIGKQYAELLLHCDIRSIPDLAKADPHALTERARDEEAARFAHIQGNPVSEKVVHHWIDAAASHERSLARSASTH